MRKLLLGAALTFGALAQSACSNPTEPCGNTEGVGIPALDLVGSLRSRGVTVTRLGQRTDLTTFSVPTQVLDVNGEELLVWEYCTGGAQDLAIDLGRYGIGVFAENPPSATVGPGEHLWAFAQIIAGYTGGNQALIGLLDDLLGDELAPP